MMKKRYLSYSILLFYIIVCYLVIFSIKWVINMYGIITIDEIFFYFQSVSKGTEASLVMSYIYNSLFKTIIVSLLSFIFIFCMFKMINCHYIKVNIKFFKLKINFLVNSIKLKKILKVFTIIGFLLLSLFYLNKLNFFEYIQNIFINSTFIKDNYVDPKKTDIIFPENKKNLICIYVESLESSYFDKQNGGLKQDNLLDPIMDLTMNNINFSSNDKFGGAKYLSGTNWTTAGLVATTSGLPLKITPGASMEQEFKNLLNGATAIGNILEENGYNQEFMIGSKKEFGNRDIYLYSHGNYYIYDFETPKQMGILPNDYVIWWGFEDSKLFNYAKDEITRLAKEDKPFNFTLLTANTHFPDGLVEESCIKKFSDSYSNSIYCSAEQLNEFVNWIQQQDFYDNTVIVITGDHLSMQADYFKEKVNKRSIYNLFINTNKQEVNTKNRIFTTLDMFPTILSSLDVEIKGNRLGLGTDLFSKEKTIPEKIGLNKFDKQISYRSDFYNKYLLR